MARPCKNSNVPGAKERIKDAFWETYTQKPLDDISVKEVCTKAHCNKTTFYYHFDDLREVLDAVEEECLPLEAPDMVEAFLAADDTAALVARFLDEMGPRFERYCVLLSSRGDPCFARKAKEILTVRWCDKLGVEYGSLSAELKTALKFTMGGTTSIFANHGDGEPFDVEAFSSVLTAVLALPLFPFARS